jgi:predicted glycoside hydrolase/deacetylase ChbG (UPF0249 family)
MSDRYLIVNADDFGASPAINRGIVEAHNHGIVTSASLMVDLPGAEDAAAAMQDLPDLGVGLHVVLTDEGGGLRIEPAECQDELDRQLARFHELAGRPPTHVDSHHNIHRDPRLGSAFLELADRHRLPMREHSGVRYHESFYGQWDGETHLEQISVESLKRMLDDLNDGITELMCHPGYIDGVFSTVYAGEREEEVKTLCDSTVREHIERLGIQLCNFSQLTPAQLGPVA